MTTLVLLPGMDGTGELFEPLVRELQGVLSIRVVGYPTHECLGYAELEALVARSLPSEPFVLLGESFSGPVAISVAARQPEGLVGLILCCSFASCPRHFAAALAPVLSLPLPKPPSALAAAVLMGRFSSAVLRLALRRSLAMVSSAVLRHRLAAALRVNVRSKLVEVNVPILYLQASADWLIPQAAASEVTSAKPGARVVQLHGPHMLLQASPVASAQAIQAFLGSIANAA